MRKSILNKLIVLLILAICASLVVLPVTAAGMHDVDVTDAVVILDGTTDLTVEVSFVASSDIGVYVVQGNWSTTENEDTEHLTLSAITSNVLSFTGNNDASISDGYLIWSEDTYTNPAQFTKDQSLFTATYTVPANTPEGDYTVSFFVDYLEYEDGDCIDVTYYTATIKVEHKAACDHQNKTYTYETNSNDTHKVKCECGEYVNESEACSDKDGDGNHTCDKCSNTAILTNCSGGTATCTAKATCTECGEKYGNLAEHTYNNGNKGTLVNAGDCVTKATYKAMCDNCAFEHETNTVEGALGGHTYGQLIEATGAVHTATELKGAVAAHYFCDVCDTYFTEGKDATTLGELTGEAPVHAHADYKKTATQHTSICSCGKEMDAAKDHIWVADGKCSVCNYECQHEDKTAGFQPTGNNTHTEYNTCNTCGTTNLDKKEGVTCTDKDKDGNHTCDFCTNTAAVTDCSGGTATCTAKAICTECGEKYGNLAEHTYNNGNKGTLVNAGDCVTKATYKAMCDNCAFEHETNTVEGALGGHTYGQLIPETEAVHTKDELKAAVAAHYFCDVCDTYFTEGKDATTLGELTGEAPVHTYDNGLKGTPVNAGDCVTKATYKAKCDNCEFEHATNVVEGELGAHTYGKTVAAQAATCLAGGNVAYKQCAVCELYFAADAAADSNEGKATNEDFLTKKDSTKHVGKETTSCTNDGATHTVTVTCECGGVVSETKGISHSYNHQTRDFECECGAKYTGWSQSTDGEGTTWTCYVKNGEVLRGWNEVEGSWYYFSTTSGQPATGMTRVPYPTKEINGVTYAPKAVDKAYWEAHKNDAEDPSKYSDAETAVFYFDQDGKFQQTTGIVNGKHFAVNGCVAWHVGFVEIDGAYYYFAGDTSDKMNGNVMVTGKVYATRDYNTGKAVDGAIYMFGEDGKLIKNAGIVDGYYYNEDNSLAIGAGLVAHGDGYIYVRSNGQVVTDAKYWLTASKLEAAGITDLKAGMYTFDENGMLVRPQVEPELDGIVEKDDKYYYYVDGVKQAGAGVIEMSDESGTFYIYVTSDGTLATGEYWPTNLNGLLKSGCYDWGTDGKYYPNAN